MAMKEPWRIFDVRCWCHQWHCIIMPTPCAMVAATHVALQMDSANPGPKSSFWQDHFSSGVKLYQGNFSISEKTSYDKIPQKVSKPRDWYDITFITMTSQWARWRLKSSASRLFTQSFIQTQIKENTKALRHWPLCGEFTGGQWISRTKGQ